MDESVKQEWVEALRFGDYEQGTGALHETNRTDRFCCLGVLCDLYQDSTGKGEWQESSVEDSDCYHFTTPNGRSKSVLPEDVREWAGLNRSRGVVLQPADLPDDNSAPHSLSSLNDANYSFDEIADIIEQNL
jgi:hypothetical protein